MKQIKENAGWVLATLVGGAVYALAFSLFLLPSNLNSGGVSGMAMVLVKIMGFGSVGTVTMLINLPLFLLGGLKIGKRFFIGSLLGMLASSGLIDVFALLPAPQCEPLIGALYGGVLGGLGLGVVFAAGTSTGGSDILIRLFKLRFRNVPLGQISMCIDMVVTVLTGIVFQDVTRALYTGVAVFATSRVIDVVVYRFDYSKVAMIITGKYEEVAAAIDSQLQRGVTYLYAQGFYSGKDTKVVLSAVKRQQLAELKELVMRIDPSAFIIMQEAHQVLGDGFARYSKDSL